MAGNMVPIPPGTLLKMQHSDWGAEQDWSKVTPAEEMGRQEAAYQGNFKPSLQRTDPREPDHNVRVNLCEPIVSTGVNFLLGEEVTFEVTDGDDGAQDWLDQALAAQPHGKMPTLTGHEINTAVFGHGFLNLVPDDPQTKPYPRLAPLNPQQMRVEVDPTDYGKATAYEFRFIDLDEETHKTPIWRRKLVVREPNGGGWTIYEQERSVATSGLPEVARLDSPDTLLGWTDMPGSPTDWAYPWPPIQDGPNMVYPNRYWGKADLRLDIIHLNEQLNAALSLYHRIEYFHAHPKVIFFGVRASVIEMATNEAHAIPNANAKVTQLEMQSDLASLQAYIDRLMELVDQLSHVPGLALGRWSGLQAVPSGVALRVRLLPLLQQTYQKRQLREVFYTKLCQRILELGGFGEAREIEVHWPELVPVDSLQEAQTALIWHGLGASRGTLLERGEFDPAVEAEKRAEEDQADAEASARRMASSGLPAMPPEEMPGDQSGQGSGQQAGQPVGEPAQQPAKQPAKQKASAA